MTVAWMPPLFGGDMGGVERWNAFVGLAGQTIPLADSNAVFALADAPATPVWVSAFSVPGAPYPLFVHVEDFPFRSLVAADLDVGDLAALPDGLRETLFDGIFATVRGLLPPGSPLAAATLTGRGLSSTYPELSGSQVQWFAVQLSLSGGATIALELACDRALVARLLPDPPVEATPVQSLLAQQITVPVDITLGSITLPLAQASALQPGAVVVLAQQPAGTLWVRADTLMFEFADTGNGWKPAGPRPARDFSQPAATTGSKAAMAENETQSDTPAAAPLQLGDLRIALDFDLARSMVPLSELSKWQAGTLVNLSPPATDAGVAVTIRANGDVVGSGDIVRIDDRIAVRITSLALRP